MARGDTLRRSLQGRRHLYGQTKGQGRRRLRIAMAGRWQASGRPLRIARKRRGNIIERGATMLPTHDPTATSLYVQNRLAKKFHTMTTRMTVAKAVLLPQNVGVSGKGGVR